jgi:hypothetical protein
MAATKRALWGALEHGLTDACKAGAEDLVSMWGHPDQTEGPRAFAERREPVWQPPVGGDRGISPAGSVAPTTEPAGESGSEGA